MHTIALATAAAATTLASTSFVRAQLASLDRGHQIIVNNGIQIWGADSNTSDAFSYSAAFGANLNGIMWGFPAQGGDILQTGFKWGKWTDPYGSPSTALNSTEQAHSSDLIGLSVGDEQDINTVGSADYNATVAWFQARNAGNYFPNTLCFVNHFFYNDSALIQFIASANPDAISFDSYPFSNPAGHYITIPNWLSKAQQVRREALGSYIGATGNSARPYGLYTQTFHDQYAVDPGDVEIRWQQFAAATMGYTITDAFLYAGGNTVFNQQGALYNSYKETARQIKNLGPALTHLISYGSGTSIVRGQDSSGGGTALPGDWLDFSQTNAPPNQQYLTSITNVTNLGTKNGGHPGDVYVGFFNPLLASYGDPAGEAYFMVTNGLGGDLSLPSGQSDNTALATDCQQSITLNFNFGSSGITSLDRLRRSDGQVEVVPLTHISGSIYSYTFTLDGGTGDLFKYDDGTAFVGTNWSPPPPPPPPPPVGTIYWDTDGSTSGNNANTGANLGGSGTWDTVSSQWWNSSNNTEGPWATNGAVFFGASGTVTLAVPVSAASLSFKSDGYVITNSTLTLTGSSVSVDAGVNATISSKISGSVGLVKSGAGALAITASNNYTGGTTITAGMLTIGSGSLGANPTTPTTNVTITNGSTLQFGINNLSLTANRNFVLGSGGGTVDTQGFNNTIAGAISGTSLTKTGSGMLVLSGSNSYTGATTINAGTLRVANGNGIGDGSAVVLAASPGVVFDLNGTAETIGSLAGGGAAGGNVTLGSGGALTTGQDVTSTTFGGLISGTNGTLTKVGGGIMTLTNSNSTYTGATTISGGTLSAATLANINTVSSIGMGSAGGSAADLVLDGGVLQFSGTTAQSTNRPFTVTAGGGGLNASSPNNSAISFTNTSAITMSGTGIRTFVLSGSSTGNNTLAAVIGNDGSGNATTLDKTGSGTWVLTGNNTYGSSSSGQWTLLDAGTLVVSSDSNFGMVPASRVTNMSLSATLRLAGSFTLNGNRIIKVGSHVAGPWTVDTNGFTLTIGNSGNIQGGVGQVIVTGGGTLDSFGGNAFGSTLTSGSNLTVDNATVTGNDSGAFGADVSTLTIALQNGGTLMPKSSFSLSRGLLLNTGGGVINTNGNNTTVVGVVSGSGSLTKVGGGTLVLQNTGNSFTGGMNFNGGVVQVSSNANLGSSSASLSFNGGTFNTSASFSAFRFVNINSGGGTIDLGSGALLTFASNISGTGTMTKTGAGSLALTEPNSNFTGMTTISAGTVLLQLPTALQNSTVNLAVNNGLNLNGLSATLGGLSGAASLALGSSATTSIGNNNTSTTYSGIISGTGGINKVGSGTFVLTGANIYAGGTTISGGTLQLGNGATTGSLYSGGAGTVTGNANFAFSFSNSPTIPLNIAGSGSITQLGPGMVTLSGTNTFGGATNINGGILRVASANSLPNSTPVVLANVSGAALDLNGVSKTIGSLSGGGNLGGNVTLGAGTLTAGGNGASTTYGGSISGSGGIVKTGTGLMSLAGSNTYSGGTTIGGGTLQVTSEANLGNTGGAVTLNNGGTLLLGGNLTGANRKINLTAGGGTVDTGGFSADFGAIDPGPLTKNGAGQMNVTSVNATNLTINNGVLHVRPSNLSSASTSNLTSAPIIAAGGQLDIEDNALIVSYGSDTMQSTRDAIRNLLINGRNAGPGQPGNWNGNGGITSSYAQANGNGFNLAIGYADNADLALVRGSGSYTSFGGQTVGSNTVLVQLTRGADATMDGVVDAQDVTILGSHFNKPNSGQWVFGDFDYSGTCDATDVTTLGSTFGKTTPTLSPAQMTAEFGAAFTQAFEAGQSGAVPEPTSLTLLGIGAMALAASRRRKRRQKA